jgi:hypothetical protein
MMVSYQAAVVRIASEFYFDDVALAELGESDQAVQTLSFVYGVRAERVCRDIERAHRILVDGD